MVWVMLVLGCYVLVGFGGCCFVAGLTCFGVFGASSLLDGFVWVDVFALYGCLLWMLVGRFGLFVVLAVWVCWWLCLELACGDGSVAIDVACWRWVWVWFGVMVTVLLIVGWYCCLLGWCFCLILGF